MVMPAKTKSRSFRRVKVKTPGAKTVTHYERRLPKQASCGECGAKLHGIPRGNSSKMANLPKTKKRPERPYGGVLCSKCSRQAIKNKLE